MQRCALLTRAATIAYVAHAKLVDVGTLHDEGAEQFGVAVGGGGGGGAAAGEEGAVRDEEGDEVLEAEAGGGG